MKIYTRKGDKGETSLIGGARVDKAHPRLEAYGALDELNATLGMLRLHVSPQTGASGVLPDIQKGLFALGAALANPDYDPSATPRLAFPIEIMEEDIDRLCAMSPELKSFVVPAGCPAAAAAHHARTVCRRAERDAASLCAEADVPDWVLAYLNRLSDWLFALAMAENAVAGVAEETL
jgi:cob(I)alamin adenosyltransferase